MVKWGRRLLGRAKAPSHGKKYVRRDSLRSNCYYHEQRREYDQYSESSFYEDGYDGEKYSDNGGWDDRDDDVVFQNEYCDEILKEHEGDESRDGDRDNDDSDDELVTRDQVLDELKAQAAAEALGKSLEQMGYNLDNCDSFYSLSEKEEIDQRYKINQRENSENSIGLKSGGSSAKKSKKRQSKGKRKKKRNKSSRSRYSAASDDDESSTYYGTHSVRGARHHSFGDYGTRGNSSSDASDSSYYEDETLTYTTGGGSALTGKTSRLSRYTGKKSAGSYKSKSMAQKKRGRDQDTYYSRRSEWTRGDSSYGKSLDHNSTLSSVSSSEESDLDLTTEYTERSTKVDRTRKKENSRRTQKVEKKRRNITPIGAERSEHITLECSSSGRQKKPEKRQIQNPQAVRRSSSAVSSSSQIGAMRSFDSFSVKGSTVDGKDEEEKEENAVDRETRKGNDAKESTKKNTSTPEELKKNADNRRSHKRRAKQQSKKDTKEGIAGIEVESMDDVSEAREKKKATQSKNGKGNASKAQESGEVSAGGRSARKGKGKDGLRDNSRDHSKSSFQDDEDRTTLDSDQGKAFKAQESSSTTVGHRKGKGRSSRDRYKSGYRDDEDTTTSDSDCNYREMKTISKQNRGRSRENSFGSRKGTVHSGTGGAKALNEQELSEDDGTKAKKREEKATHEPIRESSLSRNQAPMAMQTDSPVPTSSARKFWQRQFLSLGRKKTNDKGRQKEEGEEVEERESDIKQAVMGEDQRDIDRKAYHERGGKHHGAAKSRGRASHGSPVQERNPSHERSLERERSDSPEKLPLTERSQICVSRGRSPGSTKSKKRPSSPRDGKKERSKSFDSKRKKAAAKDIGTKNEVTQPIGHSDKQENISTVKRDEEKENKPQSSSGSISMFELATMAAMVPLAPLAAVYTCYTADRTQSFLTNGTACVDRACKDVEVQSMECAKMDDMEVVEENDDNDQTSSGKRRHKPKQREDSIIQSDEEQGSLKSSAGSKRSSKLAQLVERMDGKVMPISKVPRSPKSHSCRSKRDDVKMPNINIAGGSRSKKALTKILPHCSLKHDPLKAHIQEAPEGFESFLPSAGTLETPILSISDTATYTSQAFSTILPGRGLTVQPGVQQNCDTARKKSKRWLPKLPFGSNKRTGEKDQTNGLAEVAAVSETYQAADNNTSEPRVARAPSIMCMASKKAGANGEANMSTKALSSFWAEKPSFSAKVNKRKAKMESKGNESPPDGEVIPFSCSGKSSAVCGQVDEGAGSLLEDQSLLSEFENIAIEALRKKSQAQVKNLGPGFDQTQATHEDLLKYYDLGQTLSDVIDARQTLEHAYGVHSGGNSFDHTVDDQLVELLTHMAEMDQDDVVEIESAIKKLKRHARKLGISERDLLFSVKSAEESALSITGEESFSSKMIDVIEGYFGVPQKGHGARF